MTDKYDVKNRSGSVIGSIEKSDTDNVSSYDVGVFDFILWSGIIGVLLFLITWGGGGVLIQIFTKLYSSFASSNTSFDLSFNAAKVISGIGVLFFMVRILRGHGRTIKEDLGNKLTFVGGLIFWGLMIAAANWAFQ